MFKSRVRYQLTDCWMMLVMEQHAYTFIRAEVNAHMRDTVYTQIHNQVRDSVARAIEESYANTLLQANGIG